MNTQQEVLGFVALRSIAMAGLSRAPNAFSARVFDELSGKGYRVAPVNPKAETINGVQCYPTLSSVPKRIRGVLVFTPPGETAAIVREAAELGIRHIWIQQGAESEEALNLCDRYGLRAVAHQCILMFARPIGAMHVPHRLFSGLIGRLPR